MYQKSLNIDRKKINYRKISCFDGFRLVWESVCDLDDPKAPDSLSSYAVRLLKENFVAF